MFSNLRGKLSSFAARTFFNHAYARYGIMTQLKIDPEQKTIDIELGLKGERDVIQVHLANYRLDSTPDGGAFSAGSITVSREWMNVLAEDLLKNRPIPVPAAAMKWLKLAL